MTAQTIREFFSVLFGSRRVELLERELIEARKERDYFKGRCDRLELMLLTPRTPANILPRNQANPQAVGRKTWAQVQREDFERQMKEAKDQEAEQKAKGN